MKKLLFILMGILALTACSEDNVSDLQLTGGCSVTELALDDYEGTVDKAACRCRQEVGRRQGCTYHYRTRA